MEFRPPRRLPLPSIAVFVSIALAFDGPRLAQAAASPTGPAKPAQTAPFAPQTAPTARASPDPASATAASTFSALDLPSWLILEDEAAAKKLPWILVIDDPQCPYCMQLHLAIEKARETADREVSRAVVARLIYPLPYHDQAAHIASDAFCLEASRGSGHWSAASYLEWLIVSSWKSEAGWSGASIEELARDGGLFDSKYESHRVTSSRRRDFQTEVAKAQSKCRPGDCSEDPECEKLCATAGECRATCSAAAGAPPPSGGSPESAAKRQECLDECTNRFVSARYRQFSKIHSACLLQEGPDSAHGKTAAAFAWALEHKVPGTPTVYAGHPSIGFKALGDSDDLPGLMTLLRDALAESRALMMARGASAHN